MLSQLQNNMSKSLFNVFFFGKDLLSQKKNIEIESSNIVTLSILCSILFTYHFLGQFLLQYFFKEHEMREQADLIWVCITITISLLNCLLRKKSLKQKKILKYMILLNIMFYISMAIYQQMDVVELLKDKEVMFKQNLQLLARQDSILLETFIKNYKSNQLLGFWRILSTFAFVFSISIMFHVPLIQIIITISFIVIKFINDSQDQSDDTYLLSSILCYFIYIILFIIFIIILEERKRKEITEQFEKSWLSLFDEGEQGLILYKLNQIELDAQETQINQIDSNLQIRNDSIWLDNNLMKNQNQKHLQYSQNLYYKNPFIKKLFNKDGEGEEDLLNIQLQEIIDRDETMPKISNIITFQNIIEDFLQEDSNTACFQSYEIVVEEKLNEIKYALGQEQDAQIFNKTFVKIQMKKIIFLQETMLHINVVDIQSEILLRKEFQYRDQFQSQILRSFSHQLLTPISTQKQMVETLIECAKSETEIGQLENYSIMHQNILYQIFVISSLIDYSQIMAKKLTLNIEVFDIKQMIYEVINVFQKIIDRTQINVQIKVKNDQICNQENSKNNRTLIKSDPERFKRIFFHLMSNSLKVLQFEGQITIIIEKLEDTYNQEQEGKDSIIFNQNEGENHNQKLSNQSPKFHGCSELYRISIKDNGMGMDSQQLNNIRRGLQSVFQNHQFALSDNQDIGFGLTITQSLLRIMTKPQFQELKVESDQSKGTQFSFEIFSSQDSVPKFSNANRAKTHVLIPQDQNQSESPIFENLFKTDNKKMVKSTVEQRSFKKKATMMCSIDYISKELSAVPLHAPSIINQEDFAPQLENQGPLQIFSQTRCFDDLIRKRGDSMHRTSNFKFNANNLEKNNQFQKEGSTYDNKEKIFKEYSMNKQDSMRKLISSDHSDIEEIKQNKFDEIENYNDNVQTTLQESSEVPKEILKIVQNDGNCFDNDDENEQMNNKFCDCMIVLIADDEEFNLMALSMAFSEIGIESIEQQNGKQVMDFLMNDLDQLDCCQKPNCTQIMALITDIGMPQMDGYELVQKAQELIQLKKINPFPIIAYSAFSLNQDIQKGFQLGFDSYWVKGKLNIKDLKSYLLSAKNIQNNEQFLVN